MKRLLLALLLFFSPAQADDLAKDLVRIDGSCTMRIEDSPSFDCRQMATYTLLHNSRAFYMFWDAQDNSYMFAGGRVLQVSPLDYFLFIDRFRLISAADGGHMVAPLTGKCHTRLKADKTIEYVFCQVMSLHTSAAAVQFEFKVSMSTRFKGEKNAP